MGKYSAQIAALGPPQGKYSDQIAAYGGRSTSKRDPLAPETPGESFASGVGDFIGNYLTPAYGAASAMDPEAPLSERGMGALDVGLSAVPLLGAGYKGAKGLVKGGLKAGKEALMDAAPVAGRQLAVDAAAGGAAGLAAEGLDAAGASPWASVPLAMLAGGAAGYKLSPKLPPKGIDPEQLANILRAQELGVPLSPGSAGRKQAVGEAARVSSDPGEFGDVAQRFYAGQDVAAREGLGRAAQKPFGKEFGQELAEGDLVRGRGAAAIEPELSAARKEKGAKVGETREALEKNLPVATQLGPDIAVNLEVIAATPGAGKGLRGLINEAAKEMAERGTSLEKVNGIIKEFTTEASDVLAGMKGKEAQRIAMQAKSAMTDTAEEYLTRAGKSTGKRGGKKVQKASQDYAKAKKEAGPLIGVHNVVEKALKDKRTKMTVADEDILKTLSSGKFGKDTMEKVSGLLKPETLKKVQADMGREILTGALKDGKLSPAKLRSALSKNEKYTKLMSSEQRKSLHEMADFLEWLERPRTGGGKVQGLGGGSQTAVKQRLSELAPRWTRVFGSWAGDFIKDKLTMGGTKGAARYFKQGVNAKPTTQIRPIALPVVRTLGEKDDE